MVGGGNMGAALLGGMIESGVFAPGTLAVVELLDARRNELVDMFPGVTVVDTIPQCRSAVLAVKPPGVPAATAAAVAAGATRLLSIAAGVNIATIEAAAGADVAIVRCMPNTPALVGKGSLGDCRWEHRHRRRPEMGRIGARRRRHRRSPA